MEKQKILILLADNRSSTAKLKPKPTRLLLFWVQYDDQKNPEKPHTKSLKPGKKLKSFEKNVASIGLEN